MRMTTKDSIMGRKHDIKGGCARDWKPKLKNYRYELIEEVVDKLGELEDLADELGFDLNKLFKALKNGIYHKYYNDNIYFEKPEHLSIGLNGLVCAYRDDFDDDIIGEYRYNDYGVTWALTRKELETQKEN